MTFVIALGFSVGAGADQSRRPPQKTDKTAAIEFCREQALAYLKYPKTVEWTDMAKDESDGQWLVSGVRDARSPSGEDVEQTFTCALKRAREDGVYA